MHSSRSRPGRRRGRGHLKLFFAICLTVVLALLLAGAYLRLHGSVVGLRIERAHHIALQVLEQTGRPPEEQERYAWAIARNAVGKGLNPAVVAAIVVVESGGNPMAVAPSGDLGLMQVNVRIHAKAFDFQNTNLLNPEDNIATGTSILKTMLDRHGDGKAIAAYNGLLPEKGDYTPRVYAVLGRAGLSENVQSVKLNLSFLAAASDWMDAISTFFSLR